ncbi:hypothetical protein Tsubulata_010554 [Turnera subulata]|uniref:SPX domain-containing protein n=1 Tax=Turnera subulata TaxID=218843 RepID=A0A9Q0FPW6_9ROSI|nr:hypothetical protein Tsubulata_010554 [Turnera subulata]
MKKMKFGKEFAVQMVPEWQEAYMDYNYLKSVLKEVLRCKQQNTTSKMAAPTISSLKRRVSLYRAFSGLTNGNRESPRNGEDEVILISSVQEEGGGHYKTVFLNATEEGSFELVFFGRLDDEFNKVINFYKKKVEEVMLEAEELSKQMDALIALRIKREELAWPVLPVAALLLLLVQSIENTQGIQEVEMNSKAYSEEKSTGRKPSVDAFTPASLDVLDRVRIQIDPENPVSTVKNMLSSPTSEFSYSNHELRKAEKLMTRAFIEFHRKLRLLKSYSFLNQLAFSKIMKKYDKITLQNTSKTYLKMVDNSYLGSSYQVTKLMERVESTFIKHFANGNRRKGMETLRPKDRIERHRLTFSLDFSASLFCTCLCMLQTYSSGDEGTELGYREIFLLSAGLAILTFGGVLSNLDMEMDPNTQSFRALTELLPLALLIIMYRSSRFFLIRCAFHCLCAPFYKVQAFRNFEFYVCYYGWGSFKTRENTCRESKVFESFYFIVAIIPYWMRFLQCLRRLFEEKDTMQAYNGLKYLSTITAVAMRTTYDLRGGTVWLVMAAATSAVATISSTYWDIVIDWGLLQRGSKNRWLRDKLVIPHKSVYFVAMVLDVVLRLAWMQTVLGFRQAPFLHRTALVAIVASLEIIRRGIWNFFRLENEHLNNKKKMKFGKEFQVQMVQEWREAYMNYNYLKQVLKDILIFRQQNKPSKTAAATSSRGSLKRRVSLYRAFSGLTNENRGSSRNSEEEAILVSSVREEEGQGHYQTVFLNAAEEGGQLELVFFRRLDDEFNKVINFYKKKVEEVTVEAEQLSEQMNALVALRIKVDNPVVINEVEMSKEAGSKDSVRGGDEENPSSQGKATTHHKPTMDGFKLASLEVLDRIRIHIDPATPVLTMKNMLSKPKSELSYSKQELRKVEELMTRAFIEFHRKLRLLKSYCFLNQLAFSKIMKKYDKITSRNASKAYLKMVDNSYLGNSDEVTKLMERVEATFIKHFANGNRRKGMNNLRPKNRIERHRVTFSLGFLAGFTAALVIYTFGDVTGSTMLLYLASRKEEIFCPFNILYRSSRFFLIQCAFHCLCAPLYKCLRRLFEEKDSMHAYNALKYMSTIAAVAMRTIYDLKRGTLWLIMAAVTSGFATIVSTYWDIVIDWGLLQRGSRNRWLRDKLLIPHKSVYFLAIVSNVVLRLAWMQTVLGFRQAPFLHRSALTAIVASLEIIRRGIWNFFRKKMKFGKEFEVQMVQEWQEAYMNYNHLKQVLKGILRFRQQNKPSKTAAATTSHGSLKRRVSLYRAFSGLTNENRGSPRKSEEEVILVSSVQEEEGQGHYQTVFLNATEEGGQLELMFFRRLDDEFNKVINFYKKKVEEVTVEAEQLSKQMDALIALRIKVDNPVVIKEVEMSKEADSEDSVRGGDEENPSSQRKATDNKRSMDDFKLASLEVLDRIRIHIDPATPVSTMKNVLSNPNSELSYSKQELRKAEELMRRAFIEFHRKLRLLKSYCFLNQLAFSKIMKKYDKITSRNASKAYLKMVDNSYLGNSDEVTKLMDRVEATFIKHFANGNRRKGMDTLRPKDRIERHRVTFSLGLAVLTLGGILSNLDMEMDPRTRSFRALTELLPLALLILVLLLTICPFNILYRSSRFLLIQCAFHCLCAPLYKCLRRLFEEKDSMHAFNALKYLSIITAVAMRTTYDLRRGMLWKIMAAVSSGVATIVATYWDIVIDWGLLQWGSKNRWLRDKLVIPNKSVYFLAIVLNVVLRLAWMQTVLGFRQAPFLHRTALTAIVASLEIIRRGIWNFFRLENEHLNNVGKFRAFKPVPLPFTYDDNEDKDV